MAPKVQLKEKKDAGKPRTDLVPAEAILAAARVFEFGSRKYADRGYWGLGWSQIYAAAMRHMIAWFLGEERDPETGESHLAHFICCAMMLFEMEARGLGEDDRPITT